MSTYLVIGGSSGIGLEVTNQLAAAGHHVYATYFKNKKEGKEQITYYPLDVFREIANLDFVPEAIDGLIYCPGSINLRPFHRISPQDFEQDYHLNVIGAIKIIQAALPKLKNGRHPSIVLFSTIAVQTGLMFHTQVAASKGAVEGLTRALAAELAPRIRVNCIAPSLTDTPLASALLNTVEKKESGAQRHPLKRVGSADDIANMVTFLLSEKAAWITGQVFAVDGGMSSIKI